MNQKQHCSGHKTYSHQKPQKKDLDSQIELPDKIGFREAFWVCHLSLAHMWNGLLSFIDEFNRVRNSVHYNI